MRRLLRELEQRVKVHIANEPLGGMSTSQGELFWWFMALSKVA
jgi:hypothetical protein